MADRHWHVQTNADDGPFYTGADIFDALNVASDELDLIGQHEYEVIDLHAEHGNYEDAYHALKRSEKCGRMSANARIVAAQSTKSVIERLPTYRHNDNLTYAAEHYVTDINDDGPAGFRLWDCTEDVCAPGCQATTPSGTSHAGLSEELACDNDTEPGSDYCAQHKHHQEVV